MAYMTLKESASKDSSASTANKYLKSSGSWSSGTTNVVKEGDTLQLTNGDYWVYQDNRWQVGFGKENYTRDYVDSLCADYQKELEAKDKEIEELQKALTTLIGVKNGQN
jgi:hypothetical protein